MTATAGFSLIETLVVAAVLSVLAVGATLAVGLRGPGAEADAARFTRAFDDTRHRAVVGQVMLGLSLGPDALRPATHGSDGWAIGDAARTWQGTVRHAGTRTAPDAFAASGAPEIVILPTGQTSGFDIVFSGDGATTRCRTDGWGDLTCGPG